MIDRTSPYGICHAVITGLGASPGLGFVHTGLATSFVLDIADLYKAEFTIPLAFDLAQRGHTEERDARLGLRDRIAEDKLLGRIVHDVKTLLSPEGTDMPDVEANELWDERVGTVQGGVNWAGSEGASVVAGVSDPGMGDEHLAIIGPEFTEDTSSP
ncbi:hypothetical protein ACFXAF_38620 [Kitasatospora sp. NPDC059463]|uniref:hypothetical protein n=1 Tax=unclassified Kitasatospora TaxID=2633591 RepID=UPI003690144F